MNGLIIGLLALLFSLSGPAMGENNSFCHSLLAAKTIAQVEAKVAIRFGKVENQVSHTFRHIEAAGLERSAVQSAVLSHLEGAASQVVTGKPFNAIVEVGGQRLQYTALKLQDGTLNV